MLADGGNTAVEVVVALSIFVPVAVTIVLAWIFLHGKADDPDEQRWKRIAEQRRAAETDADDR
jgi:uncharacterized paraquat-inducible protein A